MKIIIIFYFSVGIVIFFILFVKYLYTSYLIGKNGIFEGLSVKCGGQFDDLYLSYPFVKIDFYSKHIEIQFSGKQNQIQYNNIKSIQLKKGIFSYGVEIIVFSNDKYILWIMYPEKVMNYLWGKKS